MYPQTQNLEPQLTTLDNLLTVVQQERPRQQLSFERYTLGFPDSQV